MSDAPVDPRLIMQACLDGELDAAGQMAFERTLANDGALAKEYQALLTLRRTLRDKLPRQTAPASLSDRIERAGGLGKPAPGHRQMGRETGPRPFALIGMAASLALGIVIGSGSTWWATGGGQAELVGALVSGHRRALLAGTPVDIASNDRHNVRPWFDARIAVSPPAPDLTARGFPLMGGRVDVFGGTPVPTLVYRIREHLVSVTALPVSGASTTDAPSGGYHVLSWRGSGFTFWAVTDADIPELGNFATAFKAAAASGTETTPAR